MARPLPVEYLLVDMPAAFPLSALYTFKAHLHTDAKLFHVENRQEIGETQVGFFFSTFILYVCIIHVYDIEIYLSKADLTLRKDDEIL